MIPMTIFDPNCLYVIKCLALVFVAAPVALRKESVDRNQAVVFRLQAVSGRSPQGERG